jgi:hypothetical protein
MLRRLDWRQEMLAALLVLAEAALIYVVCGFLLAASRPGDPVLPAWIVVFVMLSAHIVPHLLDEWRIWSPEYEAVTAAAIALTLLVAVKGGALPDIAVWDLEWVRQTLRALAFLPTEALRPVWGIVVLVAYAWWRGRARAEASIDSAYGMLRTGSVILAIVLIIILAAAPDTSQVRDRLSGGTIAFFVCALAAIGVARLKLEGFRTSAPLGPRWLATFVAPILAVVAIAIIGAGIFSRQFLDTVLWMLTPVFWVLSIVFEAFVIILAIIAFIILTPVVWLIGEREPRLITVTPTSATEEGQSALDQAAEAPFNMPDPLRYLIAAIILFAIFSVLTTFVFRRRRREREATDEERESVLEWGDLFGTLAARFRGLRRRQETADPFAGLRGDPRWRYTLAIRESYLRLQARGSRVGRPRRVPETADEYRPPLSRRFAADPDAADAIAIITDHYREARYSGEPASEADAQAVEDALRRVERAAAVDS